MDRQYSQRLEKIETLFDAVLPAALNPAWFAEIFPGLDAGPEAAASLAAPGRDLLDRGGKRWRPLLSLLVCEALGGGEAVLPLLPLVEFSHNASLIHDDIEDNSGLRRGKPAAHVLYGTDAALNSGCFLYFLSLARLETWDAPPEARVRVWTLWARCMRCLHLGQSMDIAWHRDLLSLPSIEDYFLMCRLKTGSLARFAAMLGAEAALNNREGAGERYAQAAEKLGVGFQILDDVKNLTTGVPGKKRGDDIAEGKKSLPLLLYLYARPGKAAFAAACLATARAGGVSVPETEDLITELEQAGVLDEARARGEALIAEAKEAFTALSAGEEAASSSPERAEARRLLAGLAEALR
jgi:octaprenyl-diphosphate synthase